MYAVLANDRGYLKKLYVTVQQKRPKYPQIFPKMQSNIRQYGGWRPR